MKSVSIFMISLVLISCSTSNRKEIIITDFSKPFSEVLKPEEGRNYSGAGYEIEGTVNDTVIVQFYNLERKYYGTFKDEIFTDYYGGLDIEFKLLPYKSGNGSVTVTYGIY